MGTRSEAQAELSAYHHGFIDAPVLAADHTPALATTDLHQHFHTAFWWNSAANKPHLDIRQVIGVKMGALDKVKLKLLCFTMELAYCALRAGFRDITAHWGVLAVFERPGLHFLVVAVQEGALCSRTLHIIHMDQSRTWRRESAHGVELKFL